MSLDKTTILNAVDSKLEKVDVPEWGGEVYLRTLTGTERDRFEASCLVGGKFGPQGMQNIRARLMVLCICDAEGKRLFDDKDAIELGAKSAAVLDRLFAAAQRLNGLSEQDVEELAKN